MSNTENVLIGQAAAEFVQKVYYLEERLKRIEALFHGLEGMENVINSLVVLEERIDHLDEKLENHRDAIRHATISIDI